MTDLRQAAEIALKQLDRDDKYLGRHSKTRSDAIEALRQALEQPQSKAEKILPYSMKLNGELLKSMQDMIDQAKIDLQQKKWVGLTDEELQEVNNWRWANSVEYAKTIEAKLKEKNCG